MTPTQVKKVMKSSGLGPGRAARIFQVSRMTIWVWRRDGTTGLNAVVLRLLMAGKITAADIEAAHDAR